MPQNEMAGSITYGQKRYLKQLVDDRNSHDAPWFNELKHGRTEYDSLSAAQASDYIQALAPNTNKEREPAESSDANENAPGRPPGPVTAKQLELIRKMMAEKGLVNDGYVDAEYLYSRLTTSTASKFIEAIKYIPRPEPAQ